MSQNHSYEEIANDYSLWIQFVDSDATMTEAEFEALSIEEKVKLQVDAFGAEQN